MFYTVTDPDGVVHIVGPSDAHEVVLGSTDPITVCGRNATGWSRDSGNAPTLNRDLILLCDDCYPE